MKPRNAFKLFNQIFICLPFFAVSAVMSLLCHAFVDSHAQNGGLEILYVAPI